MDLEKLPAEMLLRIISDLDAHSKTQVALVNKQLRNHAQDLLWRNIELHRTNRHEWDSDGTVVLSEHEEIEREYLDDGTGYERVYEDSDGRDPKFDYHNRTFGTVIEDLYLSGEKSEDWVRLSSYVLHLCLTVDDESPECIWDVILSLPKLQTLEIIGDASVNTNEIEQSNMIPHPKATSVDKVRLRGYIPGSFLGALFEASGSSITSMDLGALAAPERYDNHEEFPAYFAPVQSLWFRPAMAFNHLTHLHLCKGGSLRLFGRSLARGVASLTDPYRNCEIEDYEEWANILRAARSTLVEVILELRLIVPDTVLRSDDMGIAIDQEAPFDEDDSVLPRNFYEEVLKVAFGDGHAWPKLKTLTLHGIFDTEITNDPIETLDTFAERELPGVVVSQEPGHFMFWNTEEGRIRNEDGVDGLKPRKRLLELEDL